ncbi:hypothetical protein BVRB_014800 [Beta vulgaris subsp. vulgaris]|uniref:Glycosyltransferase n=1 Tax=Beta vulgaris subsp. vulgaris TaxID=3555 RepID=A0A0J8B1G9_BETVV|nr:hypothetical protein BVRB_014800 [Beta vulgaris subsp. vulgaris]
MAAHIGDHSGYKHNQVAVVAIPLPIQGHLNPFLRLSHLIAAYGIPVHFVSFASHNQQAKVRAHGLDQINSTITMINFHDPHFIPLPSLTNTKQNNCITKFPTHVTRICDVCHLLEHPISELIGSLSAKFKRIIVIHDSLMASLVHQDAVKIISNVESYTFHTSSAFTIFFFMWHSMVEKPFNLSSDIPHYVPSSKGCSSPEFEKFAADQYKLANLSSGRLYNTCRSLENKYMDLLTQLPANKNKKLFAIGPVNRLINTSSNTSKHKCLEWLDEQESDSVIYVSFGTTTSMTDEQIKELADGLDRSNQKFIWVLREADEVNIFKKDGTAVGEHYDQLLKGYEEAVRGRGLMVKGWAPQLEILGHEAIGGFISHCGWNSCLESLSMGVPIAAWPIHSDQPKNSMLVTEVLKVGVVVKDWANRDELITSSVVESAVRRLMASKEGEELRKRARELGASVRGSVAKGGTSCLELDSFVAHIIR